MAESKDQFLAAVVLWHERRVDSLAERHVHVRLVGPTTERSKNSVGLEFISPLQLVSVAVWDSGECEVITAAMQNGEGDLAVSVVEVAEPDAIAEVLDRVVAGLAAG